MATKRCILMGQEVVKQDVRYRLTVQSSTQAEIVMETKDGRRILREPYTGAQAQVTALVRWMQLTGLVKRQAA